MFALIFYISFNIFVLAFFFSTRFNILVLALIFQYLRQYFSFSYHSTVTPFFITSMRIKFITTSRLIR